MSWHNSSAPPREAQHLANLSHSVPGIGFLLVALLMVYATFYPRPRHLTVWNATFLLIYISIFTLFVIFYRGWRQSWAMVEVIWHYPEIRVHLVQSFAAIIGSFIELKYVRKQWRSSLAALAWPMIFIVIGYTNVLHPHGPTHNEAHTIFHAWLGAVMIAAGIFLLISRLTSVYARWFLVLGAANIIAFSCMLIIYREPPNAYEYAFTKATVASATNYLDVGRAGVVYIYDDHAEPREIKLRAGGTLEFIQVESAWHNLSSGPHPTHTEYPPLNIGFLHQGEHRVVTFTTPGNFGFHDHIHDADPKFQGKIFVYQ